MEDWDYWQWGRLFGGIAAFITFWAAWIYCMSAYGFLLGFGLGWLPAGILAAMVGIGVMVFWGLILAGAAVLAAVIWYSSNYT